MSKASVRVTSESSAFQRDMKQATQTMKELSSQTSLATTQAKLFGSAQEAAKAKVTGLKAQIEQQAQIVKLNKDRQQELVQQLDKWKSKQSELQTKIQATKAAIEQSAAATGENSAETKALKAELKELVKQEKDAATQVDKCEEKLSKQTVATNKSEQALVELRGELKKANKELKDAAWDEWTKKADKATEAMDNVGKKLTVVTGAVVGMGAAAVKTTADFDAEMSTVQSISGATGADFAALRDKALEMGSTTAFSASEAASAMEYMAMAGWSTEDMLDGIAGVMNAAAASGEDLAATSDILTDGLTAFGLAASDSAHFADVLVKAGNSANTNVAMMGETFKYAGAVCGTLGISIEDAAIATGLMGNAGIKASQAGTALRSGLTNLVKPTKAMSEAMEQYGVSVQTTSDGSVDFMATMQNVRSALGGLDETTRAAAISTIFGKEAMSGWAAIVTASDADFNNLTEAIYNCEGAAEAAAAVKLDNLSGQITNLKSTIEGIAIQIGDLLMPTIRNIVGTIQEWATAFAEADEGTKKTIVTIAGVVAAIGPVLIVAGKVVSVIGKIRKAFDALKKLKSVFTIFKTGFKLLAASAAGPVVAIAAVVAALVAAFMHLWNTNEGFRTAIIDIWNEIKNTVGTFIEGLKERLVGMGITFESVSAAIKTVWNALCEFLAPVFEGAFQQVRNFLTAATNTILDIIDFFIALFKGDWEGAWAEVQSIFGNVWQYIVATFQSVTATLKSVADVVLGWFGTDWNTAWTSIGTFFVNLWNGIVTTITGILNTIATKIDSAKSTVSSVTETIKTTMSNAWNSAKSTATSLWENIRTAIATKIDSAKATVSSVVESIKTAMSNAWNSAKNTVTSVWESIRSTIAAKIEAARATVQNIINTIKSYFNFSWSLPAVGTTVLTTAKNAVSNAVSAVKGFLQFAWNLPAIGTSILQSAKNAVSSAVSYIKGLFNFSWSLPKIKTPHFYISGYTKVLGVSIPSIGVSWYKNGGIMTDPTMFGRYGNTAMVGGEAGPEAILPLEPFYTRLTAIIDKKLDEINRANATLYLTVVTEMDGEVIAQRTTPMVADEIVKLFGRRR